MQRGNQKAASDAHRLLHVIVFDLALAAVRLLLPAVILPEDHDQVGRLFQELLVPVGAQRRQRLQPVAGEAMLVVLALFGFRRLAYLPLDARVGNHREVPGLPVGAGRCAARDANGGFDQLPRNRISRKVARGASGLQARLELSRTPPLLFHRQPLELQRDERINPFL